ncbi:hypothetical protein EWB00_000708 [Schistosoma japonicum]|uniref:Uncharacterized protein n=1 Tax=Schistosoma japonicum TaxID=6182 RepID=A0A4Z2CKW1_SCHJA|nr:hypothetical protein EWB00_000708 [Schistosoma japonicum]
MVRTYGEYDTMGMVWTRRTWTFRSYPDLHLRNQRSSSTDLVKGGPWDTKQGMARFLATSFYLSMQDERQQIEAEDEAILFLWQLWADPGTAGVRLCLQTTRFLKEFKAGSHKGGQTYTTKTRSSKAGDSAPQFTWQPTRVCLESE